MSHIVVIGAGQAGASVVSKLRASGFAGEITMIGEEPVLPYQRPPLSKKYLLGEMDLERLYLKPAAFYEENKIVTKLGVSVVGVDPESKTVCLDDETLNYDHLIFATGAYPRRLPSSIGGKLPGTYVVRSLADVDAMAPEFVAGRRVLIVGGGYIGLEAAAVAASRGLKVTLVEAAERILQRVASKETANYFRALHASHGVEILESCGLRTLLGEARVSGAELTDGRVLDVDFAIVGVGVVPATDLAEASGVAIENGIKVDAFGRTSVADVWAAGDCASFPYRDARIRLESVPNAIDQAEIVAENIMGAEKAYVAEPWFWSDQYDVKLQIAGLNTGYDRVVARDRGASKSFWYYRGERLLAVDAMKDPRAYMVAKRLLSMGKSPDPVAVANTEVDLAGILTQDTAD
jgi:3-phenylpropionate/trans-cinnamate dioxygenase ferredoxin reductase subunit